MANLKFLHVQDRHSRGEAKQYTLTRGEIQVMNALWAMPDGGNVTNILQSYDEPKPAYTTVATFLKILINKGFVVAQKRVGQKALCYRALMTREQYTQRVMADVKENFFNGSAANFFSFFIRQEQLTKNDVEELLQMISHSEEAS